MRISVTLISLALGASSVMASSWFSNAGMLKNYHVISCS